MCSGCKHDAARGGHPTTLPPPKPDPFACFCQHSWPAIQKLWAEGAFALTPNNGRELCTQYACKQGAVLLRCPDIAPRAQFPRSPSSSHPRSDLEHAANSGCKSPRSTHPCRLVQVTAKHSPVPIAASHREAPTHADCCKSPRSTHLHAGCKSPRSTRQPTPRIGVTQQYLPLNG